MMQSDPYSRFLNFDKDLQALTLDDYWEGPCHPVLLSERELVTNYLIDNFDKDLERFHAILFNLEKNPEFYISYIKQIYTTSNEQRWTRLIKEYFDKSGFYFFVGIKGSGKTTLSYSIYEQIRKHKVNRPIYCVNMSAVGDMIEIKGTDFHEIYSSLPNGSIIFVDEVHKLIDPLLQAGSKDYKILSYDFSTMRHEDKIVVFISQVTTNFNKNLLRYCDGHIYLKTTFVEKLERLEFRPFIEVASLVIKRDRFNFVFINESEVLHIDYERPSFMTMQHSLYYNQKEVQDGKL